MSAREFEADVCTVLPSGLVLHSSDEGLAASMLGEDGTLELVGPVDAGIWCGEAPVAHDPERGKLWWVTLSFDETPPVLHQLDLASNTEDWQRDLVYDGYSIWMYSMSLLAHEGALYLGGSLLFENAEALTEGRSLLERIDESGDAVWTQIGYPGFGFSEEMDGDPLEGLRTLIGTSTGISFLGYISGTDSAAITGATVDAQTGELLWSESFDRDNYFGVDLMSGDGESLYVSSSAEGWSLENDVQYAKTQPRSITPLGEQNWQSAEFVWSKFIHAQFTQAVAGGELVDLVLGAQSWEVPQRVHVARRRTSDGGLICASDLSDVTELGNVSEIEAHAVGDRLALEVSVEVDPDEFEYETTWLLLQPSE